MIFVKEKENHKKYGRAHGFGMRQLVGGERIEGTFGEVTNHLSFNS